MNDKLVTAVVKFANNDEHEYKCTIEDGQKAILDWYNNSDFIKLGTHRIYCKNEKNQKWIKEIIFT